MTLRPSLQMALRSALEATPEHAVTLSTRSKRSGTWRVVQLAIRGGDRYGTYNVVSVDKMRYDEVAEEVLTEATAYVHSIGGCVQ